MCILHFNYNTMAKPLLYVELLDNEEEKFKDIMISLKTRGRRDGNTRAGTVRYMIDKFHEALSKKGKVNLFNN